MFRGSWVFGLACWATACAKPLDTSVALRPANVRSADASASERLAACALDARVRAGLLDLSACAAGDLFLERPSAFALSEGDAREPTRPALWRGEPGAPARRVAPAVAETGHWGASRARPAACMLSSCGLPEPARRQRDGSWN